MRAYALEVGLDPEVVIEQFMSQFPQDSVTVGHPTTSQIEDYEAVESDRRTASTLLRLLAISIPIAAVVVYFGTAGRRMAKQESAVGSPQSPAGSPRSAVGSPQSDVNSAPSAVGGQQPAPSAPRAWRRRAAARAGGGRARRPLGREVTAVRQSWISAIVDGSRAAQRSSNPAKKSVLTCARKSSLPLATAGAYR